MKYKVIAATPAGTSTFEIEAKGMVDARRQAKEKLRRNFNHYYQINGIRPVVTPVKESECC